MSSLAKTSSFAAGAGHFCCDAPETKELDVPLSRMRRNDGQDEYPASDLLDVRRSRPPPKSPDAIDIKPGDGVLVLRRLLRYGGEPTVLDEITLPAALFKG